MRRDRGASTVEFAMILPAIVILFAGIGVAAKAGIAAVRAQDAASAAARVAIADRDDAARSTALDIAGTDAEVVIVREDGWIRVEVRCSAPWGLGVTARAATRAQD